MVEHPTTWLAENRRHCMMKGRGFSIHHMELEIKRGWKDGVITNEFSDMLQALRRHLRDGLFNAIVTVEYIQLYSLQCYVEGNAMLCEVFKFKFKLY